MNILNNEVKNLPLSWCIVDKASVLGRKNVKFHNAEWICLENFTSINNFISKITNIYCRKNIIIRGVNEKLSYFLSEYKFRKYLVGSEAVINLGTELYWKKSIKELCRRGQKHTNVIEVAYSKEAIVNLKEFLKETRHSNKPQLKNLFITEFCSYHRLFVAIDRNNTWQGAILISKNSESSFHTELLLKRHKSSTGIMENLVVTIAETLKKENIKAYSLGEVPFVNTDFSSFPFGKLLNMIKYIVPKFYNYSGLYFFKNKFSPQWHKIYICSNFKLSIIHIFYISLETNLIKLLIYRLFNITDYSDHR